VTDDVVEETETGTTTNIMAKKENARNHRNIALNEMSVLIRGMRKEEAALTSEDRNAADF
jgi:hypothetical protein